MLAYGLLMFSIYRRSEEMRTEKENLSSQLKQNTLLLEQREEESQQHLRDIHDSLVVTMPAYKEIFDNAFYPPTTQPDVVPATQATTTPVK